MRTIVTFSCHLSMQNLNYLIYISSAVNLMNETELEELLSVSRKNNQTKDITGMLLYGEGSFIQVLEGEHNHIESTFNIIKQDNRHKNITRILGGELKERNFPDWKMGFMSIQKTAIKRLEGYIDPNNENFLKGESSAPAVIVLKTFAETNKRSFRTRSTTLPGLPGQ